MKKMIPLKKNDFKRFVFSGEGLGEVSWSINGGKYIFILPKSSWNPADPLFYFGVLRIFLTFYCVNFKTVIFILNLVCVFLITFGLFLKASYEHGLLNLFLSYFCLFGVWLNV